MKNPKRRSRKRQRRVLPSQPSSVLPPAVAKPERLPLGDSNITWDQFEAFSRDFVSKLNGVVDSKHYGTRGSKQKGIDIFVDFANAQRWIFQCKQQRKFTRADARAAVKKKTYRVSKGKRVTKKVILVSCEVDSTVRDFIDSQATWELWDVRDISQKVRELEIEKARTLVEQHFGANWRKIFLGLTPLSPFLSPDRFFSRFLKHDRLFNHAWKLVGRTAPLAELTSFVKTKPLRVGILPGRGGIGKTKILHAFSQILAQKFPEMFVWFVQEGVPLTPEALDELPAYPAYPTVVIVDDAHRRDDLNLLFAHVGRTETQIKVLLATRVHGIDGIRSALSRSGFDVSETIIFPELKKLNREEVRNLALQALGPPLAHLANRLAQATKDSPLVTVVGGKLLAQRAVAPELLERDDEFQHAALERFRDELLGTVCSSDPAACHELLKLISATSPISPEDKAFIERAAKFLDKTPEWIIVKLGELERAGVLIRRGRTLRITPDVLSDHLLARACLSASDSPTGYADKTFAVFAGWRPERVLRNLAELDWRVTQSKGKSVDLLANVWAIIEKNFAKGDWLQRHHILEVLKEAAYFQPEPALRITKAAIKMCAVKLKKPSVGIVGPGDVLRIIPEVLRRIAFTIEFLPECCDLLWSIGRWDKRELNPWPEHALRVLQDLASYKTNKPREFNRLILACIIRWLDDPKLHEYRQTPFCVIDKLLEKKGESTWSEGARIVISEFLVSPDKTKEIREQAIEALSKAAQTARPEIAVHALESLRKVLHDNVGTTKTNRRYLQGWVPEKLRVIGQIRQIAENRTEPLILWKIQQALGRPSEDHFSQKVRSAAAQVIAGVQDTWGLRFMRALMTEPLISGRRLRSQKKTDWDKRLREEEAERHRFFNRVAEECAHRFSKAQNLFDAINQQLEQLERTGCSTWPQHLIAGVVSKNPKLGVGLAKAIVRNPDSAVGKYFHTVTTTLAQHLPLSVPPLLEAAAKTKSPQLRFSLAHHFWSSRFQKLPTKRELAVLQKLTKHRDANAARLAIDSLKSIGQHHKDIALKLLLDSDFETDSAKADAACSCLNSKFGIDPAHLDDAQLRRFVFRLCSVPDIEGHWIQELLSYATTRVPLAVVDLLIRRIAHRSTKQNPNFRPIPFQMHVSFKEVAAHRDAIKILRRVRDLALKKQWQFPYFTKELFWNVGANHCLTVLQEWLDSKDPAKIIAAGTLLEAAGENFVFSNPAFVAAALRRAHTGGDACYKSMAASLHSSVTCGSKTGTPGQPMPRDVEIRDSAIRMAKQFDADPIVRPLYEALRRGAERNIERDRQEFEEQFGDD